MSYSEFDQRAANTIRMLAADAVQRADSGHPGMPMGTADFAYVLWTRFLKHNPHDPSWPDRDRFVLSAGHGSMLLYALLHLTGYDLSLDEIKNFRQWGSQTPGHPEYGHTPGVETTTGPLGQGIGTAVGMALGERWMAAQFNQPDLPIIDHHTYVIVSDGDLMEGVSHEAAALAGHLKLGKLIVLYDDNHISIDGPTALAYSDDVAQRFASYGWHTQAVDGHDKAAVEQALNEARSVKDKPSIIACRTHIGWGSPNKHDTAGVHGSPLGEDELQLTRKNLHWPEERFFIADDVLAYFRKAIETGIEKQKKWESLFDQYADQYPELATTFKQMVFNQLPEGWDSDLPTWTSENGKMASRAASGQVINALAPNLPALLGGSADLTPSNKTDIKGQQPLTGDDFSGRYIHFGVREHGMAAMLNGMALHGGIIPYGGTFLIFSDYARPSIRLAALMKLGVIYVFTHDSIGLGEDGPTHQPVEHLAALRAIPNLNVIRPADANEVSQAWRIAITNRQIPTVLALSRQSLPLLTPADNHLEKGAYILADSDGDPDVILMASGSEVSLIWEAKQVLSSEGINVRVVSMPSWSLFDAQTEDYRQSVLPAGVPKVAVEAGSTFGWHRYTGENGSVIGLDTFGASAPGEVLMEKFGFTVENVVKTTRDLWASYKKSKS